MNKNIKIISFRYIPTKLVSFISPFRGFSAERISISYYYVFFFKELIKNILIFLSIYFAYGVIFQQMARANENIKITPLSEACSKELFGQDCMCVERLTTDSIYASRQFIELVMLGNRDQALNVLNKYYALSKDKNLYISSVSRSIFNSITNDYSNIDAFCSFNPKILLFIFTKKDLDL